MRVAGFNSVQFLFFCVSDFGQIILPFSKKLLIFNQFKPKLLREVM